MTKQSPPRPAPGSRLDMIIKANSPNLLAEKPKGGAHRLDHLRDHAGRSIFAPGKKAQSPFPTAAKVQAAVNGHGGGRSVGQAMQAIAMSHAKGGTAPAPPPVAMQRLAKRAALGSSISAGSTAAGPGGSTAASPGLRTGIPPIADASGGGDSQNW